MAETKARYAAKTKVGVTDTRLEIEQTLVRYGATGFMFAWDGDAAVIQWRTRGRYLRLTIPIPTRDEFVRRSDGGRRPVDQVDAAWQQGIRQRWRAAALVIKAKCEAVESGVTTFEEEFLAWTVLPDSSTAAEWMEPQIEQAYLSGQMPKRLPGLPAPRTPPDGYHAARGE